MWSLWVWARYPGSAFFWGFILTLLEPAGGFLLAVIPSFLFSPWENRAERTLAALLGAAAAFGVRIVVEWMFGPFDPR
jgi:hypothetical protein